MPLRIVRLGAPRHPDEDESRCDRSVLRQLLAARGADVRDD